MDDAATTTARAGEATLRRQARPLRLIRDALGGPRQLAGKAARVARTAALFATPGEIDARLDRLAARGLVPRRPSRAQIFFGGLDMLRLLITPAARAYYAEKGLSFGFHQLLRVLDDPVSMIDPTGFLSARDTIIGHLMQVVHLDPIYDLQMLEAFADGLDELERQLDAMLAGTHPRHRTIGAIVEEPDYHARLLDYLRRYRRDPTTPRMPRQQQRDPDSPLTDAERTFATLPGFLDYCAALPASIPALVSRAARAHAGSPPVESALPTPRSSPRPRSSAGQSPSR